MVAGLLVGIGGNFAAGAGYAQSADSFSQAVTAWAGNSTAAAKAYELKAAASVTQANATAAVQRFSEAAVLLALIAAFLFVGIKSFRIIVNALKTLRLHKYSVPKNTQNESPEQKLNADAKRILLADAASKQARKLLRKIFITFLLGSGIVRAIFQIMYAVAMNGQDGSNTCSPSACNPCKNVTLPRRRTSQVVILHVAGLLQHSVLDPLHPHVSNDHLVDCVAPDTGCRIVGHVWSVL